MSDIKEYIYTLQAAVANGIAANQVGTTGTNLVLNGSLTTGNQYVANDTLFWDNGKVGTQDGARKIIFTFTGNSNTTTFTITGKQTNTIANSTEIVTGGNATVGATSANYYTAVYNIAVGGANTTGGVAVGTSNAVALPLVVVNPKTNQKTVEVKIAANSTANCTLQHTLANVLTKGQNGTFNEANNDWQNNDAPTPLVGLATGAQVVLYLAPISALRVITNSYSNTPTITIRVVERMV